MPDRCPACMDLRVVALHPSRGCPKALTATTVSVARLAFALTDKPAISRTAILLSTRSKVMAVDYIISCSNNPMLVRLAMM